MPRTPRTKKVKEVSANLDTTVAQELPYYVVDLNVDGRKYHSEGPTLLKAIEDLKPGNVRMIKGILTIEYGNKKVERLIPVRQMHRLFNENKGFGAEVARVSMVKFLNLFLK